MAEEPLPPAQNNDSPPYVPSGRGAGPLTVDVIGSVVRMHYVPESDLEALATGGAISSLSLVFFGICFGGFATCWSAAYSGSITDPHKLSMFWVLTIAFVVMTAFFGVVAGIYIAKQQSKLRELKKKPAVGST